MSANRAPVTCNLGAHIGHSRHATALGDLMAHTEPDRPKKLRLESRDGTLRYVVGLHRDGRTVLVDRIELMDGKPVDEEGAGFRSLKDFEDWAGNEDSRFSQLLLMQQLREDVRGLFARIG